MISPKDEYKRLKDLDDVWDVAYFTLFEKYMIYDLRGAEKVIELEDVDQESIILGKNGGYPIPGIIYTFLYKGPDVKVGKKAYSDIVPLVFCMNTSPGYFSGINMNALPPEARLQFLQGFYDSFKDFLEREADLLSQNGREALNKRFIQYVRSGKTQDMLKLFNQKYGANFNFAYRKYNIKNLKQLRMIEYPEWKYIPFYEPKAAFRKLNQNQIYKLYRRSKEDI